MPEAPKWHQTLPAWLAVIVTVVVQTVAVSFFLANVRADVNRANGSIEQQDIRLKDVEVETRRMAVGAATVGAQLALRASNAQLYRRSSFLAIAARCTSSGPSARRRVRWPA